MIWALAYFLVGVGVASALDRWLQGQVPDNGEWPYVVGRVLVAGSIGLAWLPILLIVLGKAAWTFLATLIGMEPTNGSRRTTPRDSGPA